MNRARRLPRIAAAAVLVGTLAASASTLALAQSGSQVYAKDELAATALPHRGLPYAGLGGVSCPSLSFCMAVGSFGGGFSTGSFFERWNGRSWRRISVQRGRIQLAAVSCLSESFCLAVGTDAQGTPRVIGERWNGRSWARIGAFSPPASTLPRDANPGTGLQSLSCLTRRDCWAVGYNYGKTLVEHWSGGSWARTSAPVRNGSLMPVSCSSAGDCWAVATGLGSRGPIAPLHFNGHGWQIARLPASFTRGRYYFQAVSCRALAACWIAGSSSANGTKPAALRRVAGSWRTVSMAPAPQQYANPVVQSIDCASSSECWAVGSNTVSGPGTGPAGKDTPFAEEWDGSSWQVAKVTGAPRGAALTGVSCASASFCVAVGGAGRGTPLVAVSKPVS